MAVYSWKGLTYVQGPTSRTCSKTSREGATAGIYVVSPEGLGVENDSGTVTLTMTKGIVRECMRAQQQIWEECRAIKEPSTNIQKAKTSEELCCLCHECSMTHLPSLLEIWVRMRMLRWIHMRFTDCFHSCPWTAWQRDDLASAALLVK